MTKNELVKVLKANLQNELNDQKAYNEFIEWVKQFEGKQITKRIAKKLPTNWSYREESFGSFTTIKVYTGNHEYNIVRSDNRNDFDLNQCKELNPIYNNGTPDRIAKLEAILGSTTKLKEQLDLFTKHEKIVALIKEIKEFDQRHINYSNPAYYDVMSIIYNGVSENIANVLRVIY